MLRIYLIILTIHGHVGETLPQEGLETGSGGFETTTSYPSNITILVGDEGVLEENENEFQNSSLGSSQWQYRLQVGLSFYHNGTVKNFNDVKSSIGCAHLCSMYVNCGGFSVKTIECVLIMSGENTESFLYPNPADSWKSWLRSSFSND